MTNFFIEITQKRKKEYACKICGKNDFHSSSSLSCHRKKHHQNSVKIASKSPDKRILAEFHRNLLTGMFECKCGGLFERSSSAFYHRKCYEANEPEIENGKI